MTETGFVWWNFGTDDSDLLSFLPLSGCKRKENGRFGEVEKKERECG